MQKSYVIFLRNIHHRFKCILRSIIGVQDQPKLDTYLGCPIEVDGRSKQAFNLFGKNNPKILFAKVCEARSSEKAHLN